MSQILVVGSLAYDSVETPSGRVNRALGGSANYFSLAASLFSKVRVVGVVGEDYAASDRELLAGRGVDLAGLQVKPGQTFHWEGSYVKDLNEAVTHKTELNVFADFDPQIPSHYKDSRFVFLANISPDLQGQVLDQCKAPVLVGMDTMNFWITSKLADLKKTLSRVDLALINEKEAMMLTGEKNAISAAPKVCDLGPSTLVIKRGEYGYVLYTKEEGFHILPAFPVPKVVDPTGAGDTFAGAFFGFLARLDRKPTQVELRQACVYGTLAASFTIQDFSVAGLTKANLPALEERKQIFKKMISFES